MRRTNAFFITLIILLDLLILSGAYFYSYEPVTNGNNPEPLPIVTCSVSDSLSEKPNNPVECDVYEWNTMNIIYGPDTFLIEQQQGVDRHGEIWIGEWRFKKQE